VRIALIPSAYAPAVGGVEELTARLAGRLLGSGDEVEVWTIRHPADLPQDEVVAGIRVRRFMMPTPRMSLRALAALPRAVRQAWKALRGAASEFEPDLIHVQCFSVNGIYATWLARRLAVPLVLTLQGETVMDDSDIYGRSVTLRVSLRRAIHQAAAVTACSRFVLEDVEQHYGLEPGRGLVIPNGVELNEGAVPEALSLPFERFVLGFGRAVHNKGFDLLLSAFAEIAPRHPDVGLVIGGSGPARDDLSRSAAAAGLRERVALPGALSRGQVAWALDAARVFVMPSRVEPFGIVVIEALRAGCPTIVSSHGGASEIVSDGEDALVVDPCDTIALATAIDRLLSDRSLAAQLGRSGGARAAGFDWRVIAPQYRELYERITH
jgi:glycosyltransferase involved in cell wall biosynthesis